MGREMITTAQPAADKARLEPCPFERYHLFKDKPYEKYVQTDNLGFRVHCSRCGTVTPAFADKETAVECWNTRAQSAAGEATRMRRREITPERWEELQAALDRDGGPTEAEAEEVLQHFGTSGKEVTNQFIERLMRESLKLRAQSAAFDAVEKALYKYGSHLHGCDIHRAPSRKGGINKCDCGWAAALAQAGKVKV